MSHLRGGIGDFGEDGQTGETGEAIGSEYNVKGDKGYPGFQGIKGIVIEFVFHQTSIHTSLPSELKIIRKLTSDSQKESSKSVGEVLFQIIVGDQYPTDNIFLNFWSQFSFYMD